MPFDSSNSRRRFLVQSALAAMATGAAGAQTPKPTPSHATASEGRATETPGMPPAFGTAPGTGPAVTSQTFEAAEALMQVQMSAKERAQAAGTWRNSMAALLERRSGPRKIALGTEDVPATVWNPAIPETGLDLNRAKERGGKGGAGTETCNAAQGASAPQESSVRLHGTTVPLPAEDAAIAFAPVVWLSDWLRTGAITSERLTRIYLARLKQYDPRLHCVITLTEELALAQARAADQEMAAGKHRGPLHGIPYGAKDLLDTAGVPTTYGAEPFRNRIPREDSVVVQRLREAGAVLVAKLSLGALAFNDVWFGGQTRNPWLPEEGSSGSSAGPGSAVAAGLVGFAIGSETQGSILSPSMRCGVTGLRPTFGRVPRTGAMTLSWSCDKLGPMARNVADTMLVLQAISGRDEGDAASVNAPLGFDDGKSVKGLRVGYFPAWMKGAPATEVDRKALETVRKVGMVPVEVSLPDWPYDSLNVILFAEAAAAFEEITLDHRVNELKMQTPDAWPNSFRQARFLSAVDFVQADRLRRKAAVEMAKLMEEVDLLLVPSLRNEMMVIANFTGHPALCLPAGFVEVTQARSDWATDPAHPHPLPKFATPRKVPHGVTLIGRLFEEGTLAQAGSALERSFGMSDTPPGFRS